MTAAVVTELPPDAARIAAVAQYRVVDAAAGRDKKAVVCQMCNTGGASVAFCETCHEFACEGCVGIHKVLRAYAAHTVRMLREAAAAGAGAVSLRRPVCCSEHADEVLRMFCSSCNKAACVICGMVKHKGHEVVDVATASAGMRARLRAAVTAVAFGETKEGEFKAALAAKLAHVKGAHAATARDINAASAALVRVVLEKRDALLKSVDDFLAGQEAALRAQAKGIELHVDGVAHAMKFALDVAEHGTDSEVAATHATTLARWAAAKAEHAGVNWTPVCAEPASLRSATPEVMTEWMNKNVALVLVPALAPAPPVAAVAPPQLPRGCGTDCEKGHSSDGNCLLCGKTWCAHHSGHNCISREHKRGSWPV